jgi:hypothetical protein
MSRVTKLGPGQAALASQQILLGLLICTAPARAPHWQQGDSDRCSARRHANRIQPSMAEAAKSDDEDAFSRSWNGTLGSREAGYCFPVGTSSTWTGLGVSFGSDTPEDGCMWMSTVFDR